MHKLSLTPLLLVAASCTGQAPPEPSAALPDLAVLAGAARDRHPEAAGELDRVAVALAERPDDATALGRAGVLLADLGHDAAARATFERARALAPDDPEVARLWGRYLLLEGELAAAEPALARARELAPEHAELLLDHAEALALLGRDPEAREALERAHASAPDLVEATYRLALSVEDDDPRRATALLGRAVADDPWHLGAHANLARLLGDAPGATAVVERHLELARLSDLQVLDRPESVDRYVAETRHFANGGRTDLARTAVDRGLARHPGEPELAFLSGVLHQTAGDAEAARRAFLTALDGKPGEPRFVARLARLFTADAPLELDDASRTHLEAAARARPDDPLLREVLGR